MKKIIVVTGGAGFVGSNLIKFFVNKTNYKIISIDNYFRLKKKSYKDKKVKYIKGNTKNINKILNKYVKNIVCLFHFGEFSRIFQSFKNLINALILTLLAVKRFLNFV